MKRINDFRRGQFYIVFATLLFSIGLCHARSDDNVFIIDGVETWRLIPPSENKPAKVKNSIRNVYEATRYKENIRVHTFYNDFWHLDKAICLDETPKYDSAPSRNIFHDDNRICYFNLEMKPGKKTKVQFDLTVKDAVYFTRISLYDVFPIRHKEFRIVIPAEYPDVTLEELNFNANEDPRIKCVLETGKDGKRTYTYTVENMEGVRGDEKKAPHPQRYLPVVMIKGYFPTMHDLFSWQTDMSAVDVTIPDIDTFLDKEVYKGERASLSYRERLDRIYSWVQTNIRYIAYEEGESGHRPDSPAEVIRKRYGDCKGMANLLTALLRYEGFDANAAVVGTDEIPFRISEIPSLGATDHCICIVKDGQETLFLDATASYIHSGHIPGTIQGKDAIVIPKSGNAEECVIADIPVLSPELTARDSVRYDYRLNLEAGHLEGTVTRLIRGDLKESYISHYMSEGQKKSAEYMARSLVPLKRADIPLDMLETDFNLEDGEALVKAPIINAEALTDAGNLIYVDLNADCGSTIERIDSKERLAPYLLPGRGHIVRSSRVSLPDGAKVTYLPEDFSVSLEQVEMSCRFRQNPDGSVEMEKAITISDPMIPVAGIAAWNKALSKWNNACSRQVEISR